jgi:hypothetical protein
MPADDVGWIAVHADDVQRVLTPNGWDAAVIEGWGDHRVRIDNTEVSFSGEDAGWQVSVEGPMAAATADAVIETVAHQLAAYSREQTIWTCLQEC